MSQNNQTHFKNLAANAAESGTSYIKGSIVLCRFNSFVPENESFLKSNEIKAKTITTITGILTEITLREMLQYNIYT